MNLVGRQDVMLLAGLAVALIVVFSALYRAKNQGPNCVRPSVENAVVA